MALGGTIVPRELYIAVPANAAQQVLAGPRGIIARSMSRVRVSGSPQDAIAAFHRSHADEPIILLFRPDSSFDIREYRGGYLVLCGSIPSRFLGILPPLESTAIANASPPPHLASTTAVPQNYMYLAVHAGRVHTVLLEGYRPRKRRTVPISRTPEVAYAAFVRCMANRREKDSCAVLRVATCGFTIRHHATGVELVVPTGGVIVASALEIYPLHVNELSVFEASAFPLSPSQRILVVGEADYSFSSSLVCGHQNASNLITTSFRPEDATLRLFPEAAFNISRLISWGATILHHFDARNVPGALQNAHLISNSTCLNARRNFDLIAFTLPFTDDEGGPPGPGGEFDVARSEWRNTQSELVSQFLSSASRCLSSGGEILVSLYTNPPNRNQIGDPDDHNCSQFKRWRVAQAADSAGLRLIGKFDDPSFSRFPGYQPYKGHGSQFNASAVTRPGGRVRFYVYCMAAAA